MTTVDKIVRLSKQLLPTGALWKMVGENYMHGLFRALAQEKGKFYEDAVSIQDTLLPDNPRFTTDDAEIWERVLKLPSNSSVSLEDRKAAIRRKMAGPGNQKARGHFLYLERQFQAAGFDVWVHENLFPAYPSGYTRVAPNSLYGNANFISPEYDDTYYGEPQYGGYYNNIIANSIDQDFDNYFDLGGSLAHTFFIGGEVLGTYTSIPAAREKEFRQLVLSQKQAQLVAFLFINLI